MTYVTVELGQFRVYLIKKEIPAGDNLPGGETMTEWTKNENGEWVEADPDMSKEDYLDIFSDMDDELFHLWDLQQG